MLSSKGHQACQGLSADFPVSLSEERVVRKFRVFLGVIEMSGLGTPELVSEMMGSRFQCEARINQGGFPQ